MTEGQSSLSEVWHYMLLFLILMISKCLITVLLKSISTNRSLGSTSAPPSKSNDEIEQIKARISQLRAEEEKMTSPSDFVQQSLKRREIIQLEKELSKKISAKPQESCRQPVQSPSLPISLNIPSMALSIVYWAVNLFIVASTRHTYLSLLYSKYSSNVIVNYYHKGEEENVYIPLSVILFAESIALNQLPKIINKLFF